MLKYIDLKYKPSKNDLVYLDPCYDPLKRTSFANYTPERFCDADRENLYKFLEELSKKNKIISVINVELH